MSPKQIRRITLWTSIGLFVISLTQPCYCTTNSCADSLAVFSMGILGIVFGGACLTWLANPVLLTAWIAVKIGPKVSLIASAVALLISVSFMLFDCIVDSEAGYCHVITEYHPGYFLWVGSSGVMFVGNLILWEQKRKGTVQ